MIQIPFSTWPNPLPDGMLIAIAFYDEEVVSLHGAHWEEGSGVFTATSAIGSKRAVELFLAHMSGDNWPASFAVLYDDGWAGRFDGSLRAVAMSALVGAGTMIASDLDFIGRFVKLGRAQRVRDDHGMAVLQLPGSGNLRLPAGVGVQRPQVRPV